MSNRPSLISEAQAFRLKNWVDFTKRPSRKYLESNVLTQQKYDREKLEEFRVSVLRLRDELLIELKDQITRMNKLALAVQKAVEENDFADLAVQCRVTIEEIAYSNKQSEVVHSLLAKNLKCGEPFDSSCMIEVYQQLDSFKKTSRYFSEELPLSTNILTHVKHASKHYRRLPFLYDYFSELTHPNYGRHLIKSFGHSYPFDSVDSEAFVKDMISSVFEVLDYQGSVYSIAEKSFLILEYVLKRVLHDRTEIFTPTELDYFWFGNSQDEAINFIFLFNPIEQIHAQYKLMRGVWKLDLAGKRKSLYEEGPFKYDRWHINPLKNIWFQVDHFPLSDFMFDLKEDEVPGVKLDEHLSLRLAGRTLDTYRDLH